MRPPACSPFAVTAARICKVLADAVTNDGRMTSTPATGTTSAVDTLLDAIVAGQGAQAADVYADAAVVDATVPGWRFAIRGSAAIGSKFAEWFAAPARFDELDRRPTEHGEVVTYLLTWTEHGVPQAARHCHVLTLDDDGRVAHDMFFCGGRWDASLLARMEAEQD